MTLTFLFPGEPIAFSRPRFNSGRGYNCQRYTIFKASLATALRSLFHPPFPPNQHLRLIATFYRSTKRRVDLDNLMKALCDGIQDSGLIADDSQIKEAAIRKDYDKVNPRVEFTLSKI